MDKEFVRNQVRNEVSDLARSMGILEALVSDTGKLVGRYFGRSRKLSSEGFRDLVSQIDNTVAAEIRPVRRKLSIRQPTVTRPKSEAHELFYLFALPEDRAGRSKLFRLTSLRVLATRKKVVMEFTPTHLAVREHAAARFIERGADSIRAVRLLASSIADWAALPSIIEDVLDGVGNDRLSIPCRSTGMLMGYVDPREAVPEGMRYTFDKDFFSSEPVAASPLTPTTFVVNTYIGRSEIQDNQIGALYLMEDWRRSAGLTFDDACEAAFWPIRDLQPIVNGELDEDLCDRIRREITEPRMLRAMGNKILVPVEDVLAGASYLSIDSSEDMNDYVPLEALEMQEDCAPMSL
jgi:hypothetical protein